MSRRIGSASPAVVLQAEKDIKARLKGQHFDFNAMSAVSNVYRAGTAVRNHMERTVLAEYVLHYNEQRPHRGLDLGVPAGRAAREEPVSLAVRRHDVLGGLIHEYEPAAA